MSSFRTPQVLNCIFFLFLVLSPPPLDVVALPSSLRVKLIHIDSPASPYRQSAAQRDRRWDEISKRRLLAHMHDQAKDAINDRYYPPLFFDHPTGIFLVNFGVGDPPIPQFLIFDTGSNMLWVASGNSYDCKRSTFCTPMACGSEECGASPETRCQGNLASDPCIFEVHKKFQSNSPPVVINGSLLLDKVSFPRAKPEFPFVTFGGGFLDPHFKDEMVTGTGVLGLSTSRASIAAQLGDSYSYCFGDIYDPAYEYNTLTLGGGNLVGNSTPVLQLTFTSKIYVKLQSISVNGEVLPIDPSLFDLDISHGGTIVDSGSPSTYLARDAFEVLFRRMKEIMMVDPTYLALCVKNLRPFQVPKVEFIFEEGAKLTLGMSALFHPTSYDRHIHCFTRIEPTPLGALTPVARNLTVIGLNAQQFHNIGFDYSASRLYISDKPCDYV